MRRNDALRVLSYTVLSALLGGVVGNLIGKADPACCELLIADVARATLIGAIVGAAIGLSLTRLLRQRGR